MSLLSLILVLVVVGVVLWAINNYVPMEATFKKFLNIVVILVVLIWILSNLGVFGRLGQVQV